MKKVLILSLGRSGSLPIYAENITEYFSLDYTMFVSSFSIQKKTGVKIEEIITYRTKFEFLINTLFLLPFYIFKLLLNINKYELLYLPYQHLWDLPFILLFRIFNKKIILTVHDGVLHKGEKNFFSQTLNNTRLKYSTNHIYLTEYVKKMVSLNLNIIKNNIIVSHPIITNNYVKFNNNKCKEVNLLFLGRIDRYKGIELLMDTVTKLDSSKFNKLIIAGKSQYNINYVDHPKIEIIDKYLSEREIGELLSWCSLLVLPYTEGTQSGVITLGIYSEKPILCTNVGGFKEQLSIDEAFWCEPNHQDLLKTLKNVISDNSKSDKIVEKYKVKKKVMSWSNKSKLIEDYLQVI